MSYETTLAQSAATNFPSIFLPYLSVVVILLCIWCVIVIILRLKTIGVTKLNLSLLVFCFTTIIVIGFGPETAREIFAAQDLNLSVLNLNNPDADEEDLDAILDSAASDDKKLLAFDIFSRTRPKQAIAYIQTNVRKLPQNIRDRELGLQAMQAARRESKVILENSKTLESLIDLGEKDPFVAHLLQQGKFDTSKLTKKRINEILRKQGARIEGEGIRIKK
ncbi:MAG: hypothetical protein IH984_02475 [Planctomycetes bacterium]|nr:hypothetical protein [Planctomycetota bacterium]